MIQGKFLPGNKTILIEDNMTYMFDLAGNFIEAIPVLVNHKTGLQNFNIVSFLSSNNNTDIMIQSNGLVKFYTSKEPVQNLMMKTMSAVTPLRILNKKGKQAETSYAQCIFLFNKDISNIHNILGVIER